MRTPVLSLLAASFVLGCGSSPPVEPTTPANKPQEVAGPAPTNTVAAQTAYDLSPVPEPQDVIAFGQWKSPAATMSALSSCAALPQEALMGVSEGGVREILREVVSSSVDLRALGATVALDAPVFAVAALEPPSKRPGAFVAFSMGLTSMDRAKAAAESGGPVTELGPGLFRIASRSGTTCVIAVSAGSTPARLVCGPKEKDISALAPYLTRTLPASPAAGSDIHFELRVVPAEARFGSMLRQQVVALPVLAQAEFSIGEPKFDRAVVDAATGISDEVVAFVSDADKISVDVAMDPDKCLAASASLAMRSKSSWIGGLMGDRPDRAGPPPAIFWRAPKDSAAVFYGRGADPKRFTPILRTARLLLEGVLSRAGVGSAADHRALSDLIDIPLSPYVDTVSASGRNPMVEPKAGAKLTPQQQMDALLDGWIGWTMVGYEEGPANISKQVRKIADVYARKGFQDPLKKELGPEASKLLPKIKASRGPAALGADSLDLSIKLDKLPAKLLKLKDAKDKDVVNIELHMLLMSDGKSRTWMAVGAGKPDALVKRLLSVKTSAPEAGTIAARTDLEPLRRGAHMGGGFVSLGPIVQSLQGSMGLVGGMARGLGGRSGREDPKIERLMRALSTLPHRGETPMFLTTSVTGTADAPKGEVAVSVSKSAFEDLGWLIKTLGPR